MEKKKLLKKPPAIEKTRVLEAKLKHLIYLDFDSKKEMKAYFDSLVETAQAVEELLNEMDSKTPKKKKKSAQSAHDKLIASLMSHTIAAEPQAGGLI